MCAQHSTHKDLEKLVSSACCSEFELLACASPHGQAGRRHNLCLLRNLVLAVAVRGIGDVAAMHSGAMSLKSKAKNSDVNMKWLSRKATGAATWASRQCWLNA